MATSGLLAFSEKPFTTVPSAVWSDAGTFVGIVVVLIPSRVSSSQT